MEGTPVILWSMGGGFTVTFGLLVFMWNAMSSRFDKVDARFDKLEEKVTDMDRRLCRLEGAFASKECCYLKEDRHAKQAL